LTALGFSPEWIRPQLPENFNHVMEEALQQYGPGLIEKLVKNSMLGDEGYIEPRKVAAAFDEDWWRRGRGASMLYAVLHLEQVMKAAL
jgi:hypothetical protein